LLNYLNIFRIVAAISSPFSPSAQEAHASDEVFD
jgi:hypothetical protein